jgi:hypothetical protein
MYNYFTETIKVKVGSTSSLREAGSSAAPRFNPSHVMQPSCQMQAIQCGFYVTRFRQAQLKLINPYALTNPNSFNQKILTKHPFLLSTFYLRSPYAPRPLGSLVISCSLTPTSPRDSVKIAPSITFTVSFASFASSRAHGTIRCREADFWSLGYPVYFVGRWISGQSPTCNVPFPQNANTA